MDCIVFNQEELLSIALTGCIGLCDNTYKIPVCSNTVFVIIGNSDVSVDMTASECDKCGVKFLNFIPKYKPSYINVPLVRDGALKTVLPPESSFYSSSYTTSYSSASSYITSYASSYAASYITSYMSLYTASYTTSYASSYAASYMTSYASLYAASYMTSYAASYTNSYAASYAASYTDSYKTSYASSYFSSFESPALLPAGQIYTISVNGYGINLI